MTVLDRVADKIELVKIACEWLLVHNIAALGQHTHSMALKSLGSFAAFKTAPPCVLSASSKILRTVRSRR
jgi:hypothetical protein